MPDGDELSGKPGDDVLPGVGRATGARNELTRDLMKKAMESEECPFCPPRCEEMNAERFIDLGYRSEYWDVFHNSGPQEGAALHIMIVPKKHVTLSGKLKDRALSEQQEIIEDLQATFGYVSFARLTREGVMDFNSATVEHLHTHIIVSSGDPATDIEIPEPFRSLIKGIYSDLTSTMSEEDAVETLDKLRWYIDVYRHQLMGKAIPIRVKLSNKVGVNVPL